MTSGDLGQSDGARNRLIFQQPWFVGGQPVRYCFQVGKNFSVSSQDDGAHRSFRRQVGDAIGDWSRTLEKLMPRPLPNGDQIATRFIEVPCDRNPELTFYFGIQSQEVVAALKGERLLPAAFSYVTGYDAKKGRAKGFIWFSPDKGNERFIGRNGRDGLNQIQKELFWLEGANFFNTVIHELGHVFGVPHLLATPMSEESVLFLTRGANSDRLTSSILLDAPDELLKSTSCAQLEEVSMSSPAQPIAFKVDMLTRLCFEGSQSNQIFAASPEIKLAVSYSKISISDIEAGRKIPVADTHWLPDGIERVLYQLKERPLKPVSVAGKYLDIRGKTYRHEFFRLNPEKLWTGKYRDRSNGECSVRLHVYNQTAFQLEFRCGARKTEYDGYLNSYARKTDSVRFRAETNRN